MADTLVVSGFPGIGKSFLYWNEYGNVLDSDSMNFSWSSPGVRNPDFPNNYIRHILDNMGKADIILVSSHDIVRNALKENRVKYTLVYPDRSLKQSYIERYRKRGSDEKFVAMIDEKWDTFLNEIDAETFPTKIVLEEGQYLSDVMPRIMAKRYFEED